MTTDADRGNADAIMDIAVLALRKSELWCDEPCQDCWMCITGSEGIFYLDVDDIAQLTCISEALHQQGYMHHLRLIDNRPLLRIHIPNNFPASPEKDR